jgi:hypothetical protein
VSCVWLAELIAVTCSADTGHGAGGTEELLSRYVGLGVETQQRRVRRHAAKTIRNLAAAFGDCLAVRLVRRRIASSARFDGQTCWQSPSSRAARSSARSIWPSPQTMRHRAMRG